MEDNESIKRNSGVPVYFQLSALIEAHYIDNDEYTKPYLPVYTELAKRYNVSQYTVDKAVKVLIKKDDVYTERRKGIYINAKKKTKTNINKILIIFEQWDQILKNHYQIMILAGLQSFCLKNKLDFNFQQVPLGEYSDSLFTKFEEDLLDQHTGFIFAVSNEKVVSEIVKRMETFDKKYLFISAKKDREKYTSIGIDNVSGVAKVIDYLAQNGHKNIAYLSYSHAYSTNERELGFIEGMARNNLKVNAETKIFVEDTLNTMRDIVVDKFMAIRDKCTAVVTQNDQLAMAIMIRLISEGVKVPDEISVVGFDNHVDLVDIMRPRITSVGYDGMDLGRNAGMILLGLEANCLVPTKLHIRDSSGPINLT